MERISVFDIFKIGIGPSSSHTMGPWKSALAAIEKHLPTSNIEKVQIHLYGSLAKTGKGHGTDKAVQLGLCGFQPHLMDPKKVDSVLEEIRNNKELNYNQDKKIPFDPEDDIIFHFDETLPFHPNGITFDLHFNDRGIKRETYYSIGGGFILQEGEETTKSNREFKYPVDSGADLLKWTTASGKSVSELVKSNELCWISQEELNSFLDNIWQTMLESMYNGCHTEGVLPGGLNVIRRSYLRNKQLMNGTHYNSMFEWMEIIKKQPNSFETTMEWINCLARAVNEENAAFGRIVTAPTNGAAGVIPTVLMYHLCFNENAKDEDIHTFLLTAGEIGSIFKKNATISAAMGGCQAEIGVSSAMAAAGLVEVLGGSTGQIMMASEIAMEHHLGMTCDPIGGLVQIPCIERNCMGAIKAITAARMAMNANPNEGKVSLDQVIESMWETAKDMNSKYKETAEGGLASNITVNISEC